MFNIGFVIVALLIASFVLFLLGLFMAPRNTLWLAAALCAVVALMLKVFGVGA